MIQKPGFKHTEIGWIPEGWEVKRISEVTEQIFSGGTPDTRKPEYWDGNIPWLSSGETSNKFIRTTERKITELGVKNSSTRLAKFGDVVVASAGQGYTRGQASFCLIDTYINQSVVALRAKKEKLVPLFLFYNLLSRYPELRNISDTHSSRGSLTTKLLANLNINLPSVNEQERISKILFSIDSKIELNQRMNQTLEAIAQAIFKAWFVDFEPVRAKIEGRWKKGESLPGMPAELYDLFPDRLVYNEELGKEIPEGWRVQSIGDIVKRIKVGKKYDKKTVSSYGRIPVLDQGKSGIIGYHNNEPGVFASKDSPVIVFANHTCYMRLIHFSFSTIQNVIPFVGNKLDTIWIFFATYGKQNFIEYKGHWPDFILHKIIVPSGELTKKFSEFVYPFLSKSFQCYDESHTLSSIRDTLLPRLMSGKIRVPVDTVNEGDKP